MFIVLHHSSYWLPDKNLDLSLFHDIGSLLCATFFAISGYGMSFQWDKMSDMSFSQFLENRVWKILKPLVCISAVYVLTLILLGKFNIVRACDELLHGNTDSVLPYSWFVIVLALLYVITYIASHSNYKKTIILSSCTLYIAISMILKWGSWWYDSVLAYPIGLLWIDSLLKKLTIGKFAIVCSVGIVIALANYIKPSILSNIITPPYRGAYC